MADLQAMGRAAKETSYDLATRTTAEKNEALLAIADELEAQSDVILRENELDIAAAREQGLSEALIDRLLLTPARIMALARDTRSIAELPDPVGEDIESRVMPNGLRLSRRRIPIGVLGVIYEARPNVTIDIATLSLKAGNVVILRGGKETLRSNLALVAVIQEALKKVGFPEAAVQYVDDPDRALVAQMLRLDEYIDMIIPRGGAGLHRLCREESSIPVITGGIGICHVYVGETADLENAVDIVENAKVQRPSVCNALDTLLVHPSVAAELLPKVARRLAMNDVELRACGTALAILQRNGHGARITSAGPDDFDQEWLSLILGVKVVDGLEEAIAHIHANTTPETCTSTGTIRSGCAT